MSGEKASRAGREPSREQAVQGEATGGAGEAGAVAVSLRQRQSRRAQRADVREAVGREGAGREGAGREEAAGGTAGRCVPPRVVYTVPRVLDVGRVVDPVERNALINASYHAFSESMSRYMGSEETLGVPRLANWCTFGQHASREAGAQIVNLRAALKTMEEAAMVLAGVLTVGAPVTMLRTVPGVVPTLVRVKALYDEPGLVRQTVQLVLAKAGITRADLEETLAAYDEMLTPEWTDLIPGMLTYEQLSVVTSVLTLAGRVAVALPGVVVALKRILDNLAQGNRSIYENIAPAYARFLAAGLTSESGAVGAMRFAGDDSRFLAAAFVAYGEVRRLAGEMSCLDVADPARAALAAQRQEKANEANLLIGYQEQWVILQPIFDTMREELDAMDGTMVLRDPNGTHPLVAQWGDFYTRMGIDRTRAPADPGAIRPGALPPLGERSASGRGTIADYFQDNVSDDRIHEAPRPIRDH